ncbi:unnamed protein product [Allacma fusca]|uniref:Uncharacterized protein n=1 Tax=Allacma fusca TaxID=39272 RepID=A0A8J2JE52_9HEXA|nr:unnamed protein product [Allacma fusca]
MSMTRLDSFWNGASRGLNHQRRPHPHTKSTPGLTLVLISSDEISLIELNSIINGLLVKKEEALALSEIVLFGNITPIQTYERSVLINHQDLMTMIRFERRNHFRKQLGDY